METPRFKYFVIFAEMRTGSNFLEQNINQFADLQCYGELFNPKFIGGAKQDSLMGLSLEDREKDPGALIDKIRVKDQSIIPGFRFFYDHDPRILKSCLDDVACAKVILTRNQLDSYVSRKIATKTGQWTLTDLTDQRSAKIKFLPREFENHLETAQRFQLLLQKSLQVTGQSAYYINYDDINSVDVLNGLAKYLGSNGSTKTLKTNLKKQNPAALDSKVLNFEEMQSAIKQIDFMNLARTPSFEPRRGAGVPGYIAGNKTPMLFIPIKGAPGSQIADWIAKHDGCAASDLAQGFNQKTLRQWRRKHSGYQSLTVVRHPLDRAHFCFCEYILSPENGEYNDVRLVLGRDYGLNLPSRGADDPTYDQKAHKAVFLDFLTFLKGNLASQTSLRVDPAWASQNAILQGVSSIAPVGNIIRENDLQQSLQHIERLLGLKNIKVAAQPETRLPFALQDFYDEDVEEKSRDIYQRDYLHFGFGDWSP